MGNAIAAFAVALGVGAYIVIGGDWGKAALALAALVMVIHYATEDRPQP